MGQAALSNEKQSAPFLYLSKCPPQSSRTSPDLLKGFELILAVLETVGSSSFPLVKTEMGLRIKAMFD